MKKMNKLSGFTIVELLVVIVVIGVLSTLVAVSYSEINKRAVETGLLSDLDGAKDQLALYYSKYETYPDDLNPVSFCPTGPTIDNNYCLKLGSGVEFTYTKTGATSFSLVLTKDAISGNVTDNTSPSFAAIVPPAEQPLLPTSWKQIANGSGTTCGIALNNLAYCWGDNFTGQLGNGNTTASKVPIPVDMTGVLSGKTIKFIAVGDSHVCSIASDDKAYCWGYNYAGKLGNNSQVASYSPVAVDTSGVLSGKTIKTISVRNDETCAIASDDKAYCWGYNYYGEVGDNSTTNRQVPVAVNTAGVLSGKTIKAISVGDYDTCAIASDNLVYCWGMNDNGELGDNTIVNKSVPVAVVSSGALSGKTVISLTTGADHNCVIASDNKAYCWGNNAFSQLGTGNTTESHVPIAVATTGVLSGKTIKSITGGYYHTCVIASDNNPYCWGYNNKGQLGNNTTTSSSLAVATNIAGALSGKTLKSITAAVHYTCAIASNDQSYCWGWNSYGEHGNNTLTDSLVPTLTLLPS